MSGFTDYHAHFIYGVDDGAQTREEMYAMLDAAAADGVRHLFATSHSTPGMERFPQEIYDRHLALARYDARTSGEGPKNSIDTLLDDHFDDARMERIYPNAKKVAKAG